MKIIILAGGGGSRLFPFSRTSYPKQFLKLNSNKSLLEQTIERFLTLVKPSDIVIVTNQDYVHLVKTALVDSNAQSAHILLEPVARNTAPAIAFAVRYCISQLGCDPDEVMIVTPSDHLIGPVDRFTENMRQAAGMTESHQLVTLGIPPDSPETGYGYIKAGQPLGSGFKVDSFHEKPDLAMAEAYLAAGSYYWNSGMFAFTIAGFLEELRVNQGDLYAMMDTGLEEMRANFAEMPNISFDYAVAEKSRQVVMLPLTAEWSDIGSWDAVYDMLEKDADGNAIQGDCMQIECLNTLMLGQSRLIAGIGLEDILIVETGDVIVVARKGESQKVKELVNELKAGSRPEADEHMMAYRPWGSYTILSSGPGFKIKQIVVNPGQILSLQMHYHRSEHWIVISGKAEVTIRANRQNLYENESAFIPQKARHRLKNVGSVPLVIIEVQNGSYLGEDDIVRFEDIYGRQDASCAALI
ncbi:MAG TPA: mannose-1-phosphate guanylyltransferase/mannose-6-phosphate isomerase [Syntrophomonadaceae bacterium]|nr:mannose-1-phosphate guanylyltransferase/mannose-6-phosphate isomerase [Syntrophomonadaceae bacterium]HPR93385.1 mannose-1-phosphate guanylyltransferase/mannose-6-phosphate isomerase [Syntrophomonadaceae bacterium]